MTKRMLTLSWTLSAVFLVALVPTVAARARPVRLDASFGRMGVSRGPALPLQTLAMDALPLGGSKTLVSGMLDDHPGFEVFDRHGRPDSAFGPGGFVPPQPPTNRSGYNAWTSAAATPSGDFVLTSGTYGIGRFHPDGSSDAEFGSEGGAGPYEGGEAFASAVQPDGKILAGGYSVEHLAMINRLTPDGQPDPSFGTQDPGTLPQGTATIPDRLSHHAVIQDIAVQPDGRIVAVGADHSHGMGVLVARFTEDGRLDHSFGAAHTGVVIVRSRKWPISYGVTVKVQRRGHILIGANAGNRAASSSQQEFRMEIVRLNRDGRRDRGFGHGGIAFVPGSGSYLASLVLRHGSIYAVGNSYSTRWGIENTAITLVRLDGHGHRVRGWSRRGVYRSQVHIGAAAAVVDARGRLVIAGTVGGRKRHRIALARFRRW